MTAGRALAAALLLGGVVGCWQGDPKNLSTRAGVAYFRMDDSTITTNFGVVFVKRRNEWMRLGSAETDSLIRTHAR